MLSKLLDALFEEGDIINLRFIHEDGRRSPSIMLDYGDSDGIHTSIQEYQGNGYHAYFGVAVRDSIEGNGGQGNLKFSRAMFLDIDELGVTVEEIRERATKAGYPVPNFTVLTGGGVHCYWILDQPADLRNRDQRDDFKKRLGILSKAMGGDSSCVDSARILRIPGTINMKPERGRFECEEGRSLVVNRFLDLNRFPCTSMVINSGGRNNAIFREAIKQRNLGVLEETAYSIVWAMNETQCHPPLESEEVRTTVSSAYSREEAGGGTDEQDFRFPEAIEREIAISFIEERGDTLRFEEGLGWLRYNGKYWERGESEALNMVGAYINLLRIRSGEVGGAQERLNRLCSRSLTYRKIKDILSLASTIPSSRVNSELFDSDAMKVNFENCTVGFTADGEHTSVPHDKEDYLTSVLPSNYTPESGEPTGFLKFLKRIFEGDADIIRYLQKRLGSCLLGNVGDSKALIMFGDGANGKSVLAGVLQECLGEYCFPVPASTLTGGEGGETRVASLQGKRVGLVHEFGSNTQLNDERFKMLTGGEALISGRHLYGRHFSFRPVTSFLIMSNYLPSVNDVSHGLWRRMALIYFPVIIPEHEQDRGLMRRLIDDERDQIMAWLVEGTVGYLQEGLEEPEASRKALEEYKESEDVISVFLNEKYEPFSAGRVAISKVYEGFTEWCRRRGQKPSTSINNFGRQSHGRMIGEGEKRSRLTKQRKGGEVYLYGLAEKHESTSWLD